MYCIFVSLWCFFILFFFNKKVACLTVNVQKSQLKPGWYTTSCCFLFLVLIKNILCSGDVWDGCSETHYLQMIWQNMLHLKSFIYHLWITQAGKIDCCCRGSNISVIWSTFKWTSVLLIGKYLNGVPRKN